VDKRVGFIGLGNMGLPMSLRLLRAGHDVVVYGRSNSPVAAAVAAGAQAMASPQELGTQAAVHVLVLGDSPDVDEVLFGPRGLVEGLRPGSLIVDMCTCSPGSARATAARLGAHGCSYLDAPVSGGVRGAQDGTLSIMVGGDDADIATALPLLRELGKLVTHVGPVGSGQVAKACNQLVVASVIEAVGEALVLGAKSGVDPQLVRQVLLGGLAGNEVLARYGLRIIDGDHNAGFKSRLQLKDAHIVADLAAETGAPIPAFRVVVERLEKLVGVAGAGELDHSALAGLVEAEAEIRLSDAVGNKLVRASGGPSAWVHHSSPWNPPQMHRGYARQCCVPALRSLND
jgi:2-hydroxy-3-oxopropionate reductase